MLRSLRLILAVILIQSCFLSAASQDLLTTFQLPASYTIEIIVQEPLIKSPVAFDWDADGSLWVVEMADYPGARRGAAARGQVVFLGDTNRDGVYNKSTVFLDGLNFPNGITPWKDGVIVSASGEIFYAASTNGSGRSNFRETIISGFSLGNPQHRVNGFEYGLDNWLSAANGDSGGRIRSFSSTKPTTLGECDLRFKPDSGRYELEAGCTQYGRHRDDWGNWFGDHNVTWLWHYFLPMRYLRRNPQLFVTDLKHETANGRDSRRVFPISSTLPRYNEPEDTNQVTSACSPMPYRDELFGAEFERSVFICDPAHNLVHREVLEPDGVTFRSHRAAGEKTNEFLSSSDPWFRPVMAKTGPDGALYVLDMHRLIIEHPDYVPAELRKTLDFGAGREMGRIYRIYPKDAKLRPIPRLDKMSISKLVAALDSPNGWQRDTAQRLLVETQNKEAVALLENLVRICPRAKTRMQALCTLDGINALTNETLLVGLRDSCPGVREQAVRLCEPFLKSFNSHPSDERKNKLAETLLRLVDDPETRA